MTSFGEDAKASLATLHDLITLARELSRDLPDHFNPDRDDLLRALSAAHVATLRLSLDQGSTKTSRAAPRDAC